MCHRYWWSSPTFIAVIRSVASIAMKGISKVCYHSEVLKVLGNARTKNVGENAFVVLLKVKVCTSVRISEGHVRR